MENTPIFSCIQSGKGNEDDEECFNGAMFLSAKGETGKKEALPKNVIPMQRMIKTWLNPAITTFSRVSWKCNKDYKNPASFLPPSVEHLSGKNKANILSSPTLFCVYLPTSYVYFLWFGLMSLRHEEKNELFLFNDISKKFREKRQEQVQKLSIFESQVKKVGWRRAPASSRGKLCIYILKHVGKREPRHNAAALMMTMKVCI